MATDNLGRSVGGMSGPELAAMMGSTVGKPQRLSPDHGQKPSKIEGLLSGFVKDFNATMAQMKKATQAAADVYKKPRGDAKTSSKAEAKIDKNITNFTKAALKKGSIFVHDTHTERLLERIADSLDNMGRGAGGGRRGGGGGGGTGGGGRRPQVEPDDDGPEWRNSRTGPIKDASIEDIDRLRLFAYQINSVIGEAQKAILAGLQPMQMLFGGVVAQEVIYNKELKTTLYQTQGISGATEELQNKWMNFENARAETGFDATKFEQNYVKTLKKGIKDKEKAVRLTKTQLNTEYMIGAEAGSLGETFADWSNHLALNNNQIAEIGAGIQRTARSTGLTGENLAKAVSSSQRLMQNLQGTGRLTAEAANSAIALTAALQKKGVLEEASKFLDAATSTHGFLMAADPKTQAVLAQAADSVGKLQELKSGTWLKDAQGMKEYAVGLRNVAERYGIDIDNLSNTSAERLAAFQENVGVTAGVFKKMVEGAEEAGKPFAEKLDILDQKMLDSASAAERAALAEQKKQMIQDEGITSLVSYQEALAGGDKAMADFTAGMNAKAGELGIAQGTAAEMTSELMRKTAEQMNAELKANKLEELDVGKLMELQASGKGGAAVEQIQAAQQKLSVKKQDDTNPISKVQRELEILNEQFRGYSRSAIQSWGGLLTTVAMISTVIGQLAVSFFGLSTSLKNIKAMFTLLTGIGRNKGAAGAAAATAAPNPFANTSGTMGSQAARGVPPGAAVGGGLKASLGAISKVALPLAAITAAVGGLTQAFESGSAAAEIFGIEQGKANNEQMASAGVAGFFTGALNALTFGMIDSLGPTGELTKSLASWLYENKILSGALKVLTALWEGVVAFVKNVFMGLWEGLVAVFTPVVDVVTLLWNSLVEILSPFKSVAEALGFTGDSCGTLTSALSGLGSVIGWLLKAIGNVLGFVFSIIGGIIKGIMAVVTPVAKFVSKILAPVFVALIDTFKAIWNVLAGIFTLDPNRLWEGIKQGLLAIPKMLFNIITGAGGMLLTGLYNVFIGFPMWLLGILYDGLVGLGSMLFDAIWAVFVDFPMMLGGLMLDGLKSVFIDFPTWLFNQITSALGGLVDWVLNKIGLGSEGAVGGFTQTADEQNKHWDEKGASAMHGLGGVAGGVGDVITGDFGEGASKILSGVGETAVAAFDAVESVMPWNWFEEGTRRIDETGLGVLHQGEAVVPADELQKIVGIAEGSGPFGSGVFDPLTSMWDSITGLFGGGEETDIGKMLGSFQPDIITDSLMNTFGGMWDSITGLFDGVEEPDIGKMLSSFQPDIITNSLMNTFGGMWDGITGLFDGVEEPDIGKMLSSFQPDIITDSLMNTFGGMWDGITGLFGGAEEPDIGKILGGIQPDMLTDGLIDSVGGMWDSVKGWMGFGGEETNTATAANVPGESSLHNKVAESQISSQLPTTKLSSSEMEIMAQASLEQVEIQKMMLEALEDIAAYSKPDTKIRSGGPDAGDTQTRRISSRPANYYKWTTGLHSQVAAKNAINAGSV